MPIYFQSEGKLSDWEWAKDDREPGGMPRQTAEGIEMELEAGYVQQTVWVGKSLNIPGAIYIEQSLRFGAGFDWTPKPGSEEWGKEHKLIIANVRGGAPGRILINLRRGGKSPVLAVHFERCDPYGEYERSQGPGVGVSIISATPWPNDGQFHDLEFYAERTGSGRDRVVLKLDGRVVFDVIGKTGTSPVPPIENIEVGAYYNDGAIQDQSFTIGRTLISDRIPATPVIVTPPAQPTPPTQPRPTDPREELAQRLEGTADYLTARLADLAKRIRSIKIQ